MFDEARIALEFLGVTADVTGKIAHEVTTSGVAHYDAADATPLWLRFVAAYAEWMGDLATVRALWSQVRAAFAFVLSHDRDDDGLPENSGVGHGWVESGPLGGGAVTSYVAAIWIDALRRLAPLAERLGDRDLFERVTQARARAEAAIETRLRDQATGRLVLHLSEDGRAVADLTALSAVPVLLGVDDTAGGDAVVLWPGAAPAG
jgi:glycogen debranching enzyme